jgi:hypothetical protein
MNRRSALGFLGMGAVAGPAIAQEAVNQIGFDPPVPSSGFLGYTDDGKYDNHIYSLSNRDPIKDWQEKLSYLTNDPAKWIADRMADELRSEYSEITKVEEKTSDHVIEEDYDALFNSI